MKAAYKEAWYKRTTSGKGNDVLATCACFDRVRMLPTRARVM